jgi:uncharacterized membrane protein YbhN (UPF0104 family)
MRRDPPEGARRTADLAAPERARRRPNVLRVLLHLIGFALFAVLVVRFWPGIRSTWGQIHWGTFAVACAVVPLEMVFRAQRFRLLTRDMVGAVSYRFAYLVYLAGVFFGTVTPGRIGEFAKVHYLMKEKGATALQALRPTLVDRVFDMLFLAAVGGVGWAVLGIHRAVGATPAKIIGFAALAVVLVTGPVWGRPPIRALARRSFLKGRPARLLVWLDETLAAFFTPLGGKSAVLTLLAYALGFFQVWLVARSVGITEIPFLTLCVIMAAISLAMLLPISVSGFGTREAAAVLLMGQMYGIAQERAISFSLLYFGSVNVFGGLVGLACWLAMPLHRGEGLKKSIAAFRAEMEETE